MYVCEYCRRQVKDLRGHLERMAGRDNHPAQDQPRQTSSAGKKTLELALPQTREKVLPAEQGYHCVDCGASVKEGAEQCQSCGAKLDWGSV